MGTSIPLQIEFAGMVQDAPRDALPSGAVWNCVDFVPQKISAQLQKRGGWTYGSPALAATTYVQALVRTPDYGAGAFNLAIASDGHVYKFTNSTSSDIGTAFAVAQNPVVHRHDSQTWMVVIPAASGTTTPKSYDGTTFQDLAGTPPKAIYAAVWEDYTLLANGQIGSTSFPGRLWFSPAGQADGTWNTTNSWWDFQVPITGLGVVRGAILAFHAGTTSRLRGTTPATSTAVSDFVQDDPFPGDSAVGCIDARSIVHYQENIYWADFNGIYMSDGVALTNLTASGGMSAYWRGLLVNWVAGYSIASVVMNDVLIVSVLDNSHNPVDCLCYDLLRKFWFRVSNMKGYSFMHVPGATSGKTYMGLGNTGRVADLSTVFLAQSASDADGTVIAPYIETGAYRGYTRLHRKWIPSQGIQAWLRLYANYECVTSATASPPFLTVSYATDPLDPNNTVYTALSPTLPATTLRARKRIDLRFRSSQVAFKVQQTNASVDTMFHGIEAEFYPVEPSRLI